MSWTAALAAVTVSIAACTSSTSSEPQQTTGSVSEVRIGVLVPKSGPDAAAGAEALQGAELAAELISGDEGTVPLAGAGSEGLAGLGGAKLTLVPVDTKSDPNAAAAAGARLITQQQVVGLVGAYDAAVTEIASQRTERLQVPFVNGDSTADYLSLIHI